MKKRAANVLGQNSLTQPCPRERLNAGHHVQSRASSASDRTARPLSWGIEAKGREGSVYFFFRGATSVFLVSFLAWASAFSYCAVGLMMTSDSFPLTQTSALPRCTMAFTR